MRQRRTDLALEAKELWEESARQTARLEGVAAFTETREGRFWTSGGRRPWASRWGGM